MLDRTMLVFLFLPSARFKSTWGGILGFLLFFLADVIIVIVMEQQLFIQCCK